jgi:hypothetical protein
VSIPVYLVVDVPWPGAFTSGASGATSSVFVSSRFRGSTLSEIVLHEVIHALEIDADPLSPLVRLDREMERRELPPSDQRSQFSHALVFVQAAETVRRLIDSNHVDYGVSHAYYERVPCSQLVRDHWVRCLRGDIDADTAVARMIADVFPA